MGSLIEKIVDKIYDLIVKALFSEETVASFNSKVARVLEKDVLDILGFSGGYLPLKYIVWVIAFCIIAYSVVRFLYTAKKMLQKIVDSNVSVLGAILYSYGVSDGEVFETKAEEVCMDSVPSDFRDFGYTPQIVIDNETVSLLNNASKAYRVPNWKYNLITLFGLLAYPKNVDLTELHSLITQLNNELRTLSLSDVQQLPKEEKDKLSFKLMVLNVAVNVVTNVGEDISILRSNRKLKKVPFNRVGNVLINENQDSNTRKAELIKIQNELTPLKSMLARNIVLQDYFHAYSSTTASIVSSSEFNDSGSNVVYLGLPLRFFNGKQYMAIIILGPSFKHLPDNDKVLATIKKVIGKHQWAIQVKSFINRFVFRK
ncbi:hypothetical protein [Virgibacillus halodenitrificans]|uniref:hypothetical protein n=1 Tax=Virgibacillus halodenitrificans TaxID=1482 RepID=UPI000EF4FED0|nr:hypothetical protein [Virgibacillus halodenitrificans]